MDKSKDIAQLLPLNDIYKDIAQPAAKQVGGALESTAKVARLLLAPIEFLAAQGERWQRYLQRVAEKVPEERRIEAHPQIVGPVVEDLRYVDEQSIIAELFVNLLARGIDSERVNEAHPAFVKIISQLSSDEAKMIYWLRKKRHHYTQYEAFNPDTKQVSSCKIIKNEFPSDKFTFPENFNIYLSHLDSLNLVAVFSGEFDREIVCEGSIQVPKGTFYRSYVELTSFGKMFAEACVPEEFPAL